MLNKKTSKKISMHFLIKCEQPETSNIISKLLILSDNNSFCHFQQLHAVPTTSVVRFERICPGKEMGVSAPGGKREVLTAGEGFVRCYEINQFRYFNLTLTRPSMQLWIATPVLHAMTKTPDRGQGRP